MVGEDTNDLVLYKPGCEHENARIFSVNARILHISTKIPHRKHEIWFCMG